MVDPKVGISAPMKSILTPRDPSQPKGLHLFPDAGLIGDCVHCGFCLPSCPTYQLWGEETDSPRGRIYLMKEALNGAPLDPAAGVHFDRCLGCMACMTACPSGVKYDQLILKTRTQIETSHRRSFSQRVFRGAIFGLFCYPKRLRVAGIMLRIYQRSGLKTLLQHKAILNRLPASLRTMESLAPTLTKPTSFPELIKATGERRGVVGMLTGCVQSIMFPKVNEATARVLSAEGFDVIIPQAQGCCGALSAHSGRANEATGFAKSLLDVFGEYQLDALVVNSAGCGSILKEYPLLFANDEKNVVRAHELASITKDVSEFLAEHEPIAVRHPMEMTVAYHDACHLAHAQQIRSAPRELLSQIPDVEIREIANAEICCGSAGVYNILEPVPATELGDRKATDVKETSADLLVAGNPGCLMQIAAALKRVEAEMKTAHTIEVLDASLRGLEPEELFSRKSVSKKS